MNACIILLLSLLLLLAAARARRDEESALASLDATLRHFWSPSRGRSATAGGGAVSSRSVTACAVIRNERRYVEEWLAYHRLLGVTKFILFDNDSSDGGVAASLVPLVSSGLVWLGNVSGPKRGAQERVLEACYAEHGDGCVVAALLRNS